MKNTEITPYIVSIDEYKEKINGYTPNKAYEFHTMSAKMADIDFSKIIKNHKYKKVILLSGGSASGKTEYLYTYLTDENAIIYDGTLSTIEGAKIKIKKCLKNHKTVELHFIIPDDFKRAFAAFLNRDRKFDDIIFYQTHSGSRTVILWVAKNFPQISIKIIESSYKKEKMKYKISKFRNRNQLLEYIKKLQYNINDIIKKVVS